MKLFRLSRLRGLGVFGKRYAQDFGTIRRIRCCQWEQSRPVLYYQRWATPEFLELSSLLLLPLRALDVERDLRGGGGGGGDSDGGALGDR